MSHRFGTELGSAGKELTRIQGEIVHADSIALSPISTQKERAAAQRAAAYVWLAALLERTVRDALKATVREITAAAPPLNQIRASLHTLLCDAHFASIAAQRRSASWETKRKIFESTAATDAAVFSEDLLPLDGKTLRGEHFDVIWAVFDIHGDSLPTPRHRIALKDLAEGRNDVAHGNIDPIVFGRTKATTDMLRLASHIDDVITHLLVKLDDYLSNAGFNK
ncbi:MAE_28990/MAE_18760 family HEPN-like nuclease [Roseateles sp. P5_D6]